MIAILQQLKRRILFCCLGLSLIFGSVPLGSLNVAYAQPGESVGIAELATASGLELFRTAYENRYTWDKQFPGYSAEVSVRYNRELYHGLVQVNPDLSVAVKNIDSEVVHQLVANQLQMEVTHRRRVPFETVHGQHTFELEGTNDTGAVQIREAGDQMKSYYKVQNQKITQVNRVMGDVTVTVNTLGFETPPEGYLADHYQSIFRNTQTGEVLEKDDVRDFHEKIGKYYLLTNRAIRSVEQGSLDRDQGVDTLIRFNDIQPLPEASV
jgi:hypothetical protein